MGVQVRKSVLRQAGVTVGPLGARTYSYSTFSTHTKCIICMDIDNRWKKAPIGSLASRIKFLGK